MDPREHLAHFMWLLPNKEDRKAVYNVITKTKLTVEQVLHPSNR
jgi:hypothetical protein